MRLNLDAGAFLRQNWQREHLFVPQGVLDFCPPADADELAGLALETDADSRIVGTVDGVWYQQSGPFSVEDLQRHGAWSLLVQSVDHHWDEAAELLKLVDWLPSWRFDDVLMSYATDGGSAAPHFDRYDVFIIQGEGQRHWKVGEFCDSSTPLLPNSEVSILAEFNSREEYLLQTGDVLYLPPGCSHYGVSVGESTSFSIGFRAPRLSDLLARCADNLLERMDPQRLLLDAGRPASARAGEISDDDLREARLQLITLIQEGESDWLGEVVTAGGIASPAADAADRNIDGGGALLRKVPGGRIAWRREGGTLHVYANGVSRRADSSCIPLMEALCADEELSAAREMNEHPAAGALLRWLEDEGVLQIYA